MNLQPTRSHAQLPSGDWRITITPPEWSGFTKGSVVILTPQQFSKYQRWLQSGEKIQDVFPELTSDQREAILSGITNEEWEKFYP